MSKAILTLKGAKQLGRPDLEGQEVECEVDWWSRGIKKIRFSGHRVRGSLTIGGQNPGAKVRGSRT